MDADMITFTHPELNRPVEAIGGSYVLTDERKISHRGEDLLVFSGQALFDTACCGTGGCAYTLVPGFIVRYRFGKDDAGRWLSRVRSIRDAHLKKEIRQQLLAGTNTLQVQFL